MISPATRPSQVLFVHPSDDLYGSDVIILEILKRLDRSKFEPVVVMPTDMKHLGLLSAELRAASIEYYHLPILIMRRRAFQPKNVFTLIKLLIVGTWRLRQLIKKKNVAVIHSTTSAVFAGPLVAWLTRTPHIAHIHEIVISPQAVRKLIHSIARHTGDRIICISNSVRDHFLKDQPEAVGKVRVVRNSIALPVSPLRTVDEMRAELGVPGNLPVIGMVGRISHWKGQEIFIRAAAILRDEGIACSFVAIGGVFDNEEKHRSQIRGVIESLGVEDVVKLVDFRKDARELIGAFDIFVLPSILPEPFGLVILEAMAAAKPVIATAHGGPLEIVVPEVTGLLVPPSEPEALALAIKDLLADPEKAKRMGQAGYKRMVEEFEINQYVRRIEHVYDEVLAGA